MVRKRKNNFPGLRRGNSPICVGNISTPVFTLFLITNFLLFIPKMGNKIEKKMYF